MEVSDQLHAPNALPARKETTLIEDEVGWVSDPVWTFGGISVNDSHRCGSGNENFCVLKSYEPPPPILTTYFPKIHLTN